MKDKYEITLVARYTDDTDFSSNTVRETAFASDGSQVLGAIDRAFGNIIDRESKKFKHPTVTNGTVSLLHGIARKMVVDEMRPLVSEPFGIAFHEVFFDECSLMDRYGIPNVLAVYVNETDGGDETDETNETAERPSSKDDVEKTTETEPVDFAKIASFLAYAAERLENGDADFENAVLAVNKAVDNALSDNHTTIPW